jgi:hypothetical protein
MPQGPRAQLTVLQDLRVPQGDGPAPPLAPDADAQPADQVLAEVDDGATGG